MLRPQINQHVKLYFNNGFILEGTVLMWDIKNSKASIQSLDDYGDYFIINKLEDVMAVKVFSNKTIFKPSEKKPVYVDEELKTPERDPTLRAMKLADLRKLRGREERELARQAMTTFNAPGASFDYAARYGLPGKLQPESAKYNSAKESRTRDTTNKK